MPVRLYNTLTQKIEDFVPATPGKVKLYVCGITVYDLAHAGHGRTYTTFDVLVRFLRARGFEVQHCQNVTDVDDKIVNRAKERGEKPLDLSKRMDDLANQHLRAIGCLAPTMMPRVSTTIEGIVEITKTLIDKGHAYVAEAQDGKGKDVYYAVRSFTGYGKLSRRNIEELRAGASERLADGSSEVKKDPLDFALWKASGPDDFGFDSPWGRGRPGWHIECSAMANRELGEQIDIHGGGMDLVFPHHENEIAQSEAANGKEFSKFWMHGGFLEIDSEKMAKSLGNFVTIKDVLEHNDPEAYRYFVLGTHYRGPLSFDVTKHPDGRVTFPGLDDAERRMDYLYSARDALVKLAEDSEPGEPNILQGQATIVAEAKDKVLEALDRDLNTPVALSVLAELGKAANEIMMQAPKMKKDPAKNEAIKKLAAAAVRAMGAACAPLGLMQASSEDYWNRTKARRLRLRRLDSSLIDGKIAARGEARKAKDFARADAIRKELAAQGIEIFDGTDATAWKIAPTQPDEILAGLKVLVALAKADGTVHENERLAIENALEGLDLPEHTTVDGLLASKIDLDSELAIIRSSEVKRQTFESACALALADGEASDVERVMLEKIRTVFELADPVATSQRVKDSLERAFSSFGDEAFSKRDTAIDDEVNRFAVLSGALASVSLPSFAEGIDLANDVRLARKIGTFYGRAHPEDGYWRTFASNVLGSPGSWFGVTLFARLVPSSRVVGAYASTFALGKATKLYFEKSEAASTDDLRAAFKDAKKEGTSLAKESRAAIDEKKTRVEAVKATLDADLAAKKITEAEYVTKLVALD